jgi:hypothetical protein
MHKITSSRARLANISALVALTFVASAAAGAQGWKTPTGSAKAAWVSNGGVTTTIAGSTLPSGGGIEKADEAGAGVSGLLSTSSATSVTSGASSAELLGAQGVATAADVNILGGRITASRVYAVAIVSDAGSKTTVDSDGSSVSDLVIDGVAYGETVAPNTRVDLPGAGYVILNEQSKGKGRSTSLTVNMIHVYLTNGSQVLVASVTSGNGG